MANTQETPLPPIPDYDLLRCVGKGAYGEVWLARSVLGAYRAAKIIRRGKFADDRPFERELFGIRKFEPVSRNHRNLVPILHVGREASGASFHYIMEVADDVRSGIQIDPERYQPRTLASERKLRQRLPVQECLRIGMALSDALSYLHHCGLIHRDIKPSNIIFVNGVPKLADIGLVTVIGDRVSNYGTAGFIPSEGPGSPTGDIFALGKVLYEIFTGKLEAEFPNLPTPIEDTYLPLEVALNRIILKACEDNPRSRYQTASELYVALASVANADKRDGRPPSSTLPISADQSRANTLQVCLLHKPDTEADNRLLELLQTELSRHGCEVFLGKQPAGEAEWARQIEARISGSNAVIILLSPASVQSEMLAWQVKLARQAGQGPAGRPILLPVRVQYSGDLPEPLGSILNPLPCHCWDSPADDERLVAELLRALEPSWRPPDPITTVDVEESDSGAVPLDSKLYVTRPTDRQFQAAIVRRDSLVLVKGARQMGKSSLLARGVQQAREAGARVVVTDLQKLNTDQLASIETFYLTLGEDYLAEQLKLPVAPEAVWDKRRSPNTNFERYLRQVLGTQSTHLVWALDEVDRLFTCSFGSEVFGLFRAWHNERALDPAGPWARLTLAMAYATEAHLFITDVNQSPFNVGTRLALDDFTLEQVADLNERHRSPLRSQEELHSFFALVGGQPYLVRRGLNELARGNLTFARFTTEADRDEGLFGDHLRRMLLLLSKDLVLTEAVRGVLNGQPCADTSSFYRLRSAGVLKGDAPREAKMRCNIYARYLRERLKIAAGSVRSISSDEILRTDPARPK
jgi:serine/threonine protein kinase